MSEPLIVCLVCHRQRNCLLHRRAGHPPTKARAYLRRTCPTPTACQFRYCAGLGSGLALSPQAKELP